MSNLVIFASSNATQTGVQINDQTNWVPIDSSRDSLTGLVVSLYSTDSVTPISTYRLTELELNTFIDTGTIEISFLKLNGNLYVEDGWYWVSINGNAGNLISNNSGFGIYAGITGAVFSQVNDLHVPEDIKYNAEKIIMPVLYLEGLKYLDTTSVNSRDTKFNKTLLSIQRMLLRI